MGNKEKYVNVECELYDGIFKIDIYNKTASEIEIGVIYFIDAENKTEIFKRSYLDNGGNDFIIKAYTCETREMKGVTYSSKTHNTNNGYFIRIDSSYGYFESITYYL